MKLRSVLLTAVALLCFAGNSILCRLALAERRIDAASFTAVRLASGAALLVLLARRRPRAAVGAAAARGRYLSALSLFAYAAPFSYAYLVLGAAMGALILFAVVQVTMLGWGVARGERPTPLAWVGIALALGGLVWLTLPGRSAPDALGAALMATAGVAWGAYSLYGRGKTGDPVVATSAAFLRALPFGAVLLGIAAAVSGLHAGSAGVALAAASGAIASGLGYSVWYAALRHLSATRAAVVQLLTPVLAAAGAVLVLGESLLTRLVFSSLAILGGVAVTIREREAPRRIA